MTKIRQILLVLIIYFICLGCGEKRKVAPQQPQQVSKPSVDQQIVEMEQITEPSVVFSKYTYEGLPYRDPFLPLSGEKVAKAKLGLTKDAIVPSLGSLQLKGFITDKQDNIALFSSPYGSYIFVNGKLYDNQNRIVKGFSGKIIFDPVTKHPKNIILVTENNEYKEYTLTK